MSRVSLPSVSITDCMPSDMLLTFDARVLHELQVCSAAGWDSCTHATWNHFIQIIHLIVSESLCSFLEYLQPFSRHSSAVSIVLLLFF